MAWFGAGDDEPLRRTGWKGLWKERSYLSGEEFRRYIEKHLTMRPPHPDAKPLGAFTIGPRTEELTGVVGNGLCDVERGGVPAHVVGAHFAFLDHASNGVFQDAWPCRIPLTNRALALRLRALRLDSPCIGRSISAQNHASVRRRVVVAEIGARSETESADKTGAQVAYDIAEHVFGYEHRVILWVLEHPHTNRVDVRVVGADIGIILGDILEATHHQAAGLAQHIRLFDQRDALATGFLCEFECLFANVGATLLAHNASGKRDIFLSRLIFPLLHFRVCAQRGVNRFWQRKKFHAAVHALGVFSEDDSIDRYIFAARVCDLVTARF